MDFELHLTTETVDQLKLLKPLCVEPQSSIRSALGVLKKHATGSLCVCRDGILLGIFTERDALRIMAARGDLDKPIESAMTPNPVTVKAGDSVASAIRKMSAGGYRRLPMVDDDGRVTGKINVTGIIHYLVEHFPTAVYNLPPQPHAVMLHADGA